MIMEPSEPRATSLTALNFFRSAQTLCGLNTGPAARPSVEDASAFDDGGAENVNTSPLEDRAENVSSQQVIFEMHASLIDCGGR